MVREPTQGETGKVEVRDDSPGRKSLRLDWSSERTKFRESLPTVGSPSSLVPEPSTGTEGYQSMVNDRHSSPRYDPSTTRNVPSTVKRRLYPVQKLPDPYVSGSFLPTPTIRKVVISFSDSRTSSVRSEKSQL